MIPKLLFIDCFALIKVWVAGFFGFHISGFIHILPLAATIALLLGILSRKSIIRYNKQKIRIS